MQIILDNDCFLSEVLMIKELWELCILIGRDHILVDYLKFSVSNCRNFFSQEKNWSCILTNSYSGHTLTQKKGPRSKSRKVWTWLGTSGHNQPKSSLSYNTFLWCTSHVKIKDIDAFLKQIMMNKKSCSLIGQEYFGL